MGSFKRKISRNHVRALRFAMRMRRYSKVAEEKAPPPPPARNLTPAERIEVARMAREMAERIKRENMERLAGAPPTPPQEPSA